MSRIHLEIDRLVLGGMEPSERLAFVASLKDELRSILAEPVSRRAMAESRRVPVVRLGRVHFESGSAGANKLGKNVARGIGRSLS